MERRDLIRRLALVLTLAAVVPATAAARTTSVHWSVVAQGATESTGGSAPIGYVAVTRPQVARFASRLTVHDRTVVGRVALTSTGLVAVFLYGLPCGSDARVDQVARVAATVSVRVSYVPPPVGYGTCVRVSTPYFVIGVPRRALGRPAATHVRVVAVARS